MGRIDVNRWLRNGQHAASSIVTLATVANRGAILQVNRDDEQRVILRYLEVLIIFQGKQGLRNRAPCLGNAIR
jgi:hypothetical protein